MLHRLLCSTAFVLVAGAAIAAELPSDGNFVPPHSGSSSGQSQGGDTSPAPQSPYVDEGNGGGNSPLPSDGNVIPPHSGGSSDSSGGGSDGSSDGGVVGGGSPLPSDGNVIPPHSGGSSAPQTQPPANDDKSI